MAMSDHSTTHKTSRELRKFGFTMAIAFGLLSTLLWWLDKSTWPAMAWVAGGFLAPALSWPALLRPIEWAWMKMALAMGYVMTRVLLTLTFYLVMTPLGLVMRLLGKDSLQLRRNPEQSSYWIAVEEDGPCSRPEKPY